MSSATRIQCIIFSSFVVAVIMFILVAFGSEMFNTKASTTFTTITRDKIVVDVIVLTSAPYSDKTWEKIEKTVKVVTTNTEYNDLPATYTGIMDSADWSLLTISASKQVYKVNE